MQTVYRNPTVRVSDLVCCNADSNKILVFPSQDVVNEMLATGVLNPLTGFETCQSGGQGTFFNFIASNGQRTQQRDRGRTYFTHMLPANKIIRSVEIYHGEWIYAFRFFDKAKLPIFKIGMIDSTNDDVATVILADNEVIVGVLASLYPGYQSAYTNF